MLNRVQLIGNLGSDPEIRTTNNGKKVANFSVATSEHYKDSTGERKSVTTWHNVKAWEGLAEIAGKFLQKGSKVYLSGKIRNRTYQANDGTTKHTTEIHADEILMLGEKPAHAQSNVQSVSNNRDPWD